MSRSRLTLSLASLLVGMSLVISACQREQVTPPAAKPGQPATVAAAPAVNTEEPKPSAPAPETAVTRAEAAAEAVPAAAQEAGPAEAPVVVAQAQRGTAVGAPGVLATGDGESPGLRVEIQELKRTTGETVTMRFTLINESEKAVGFGCGTFGDCGSISGTHLIDGKNKYAVVRDKESTCLCSKGLNAVEPKGRRSLWARFPAPPDNVQKVTVIVPHFLPIDDVPIGR